MFTSILMYEMSLNAPLKKKKHSVPNSGSRIWTLAPFFSCVHVQLEVIYSE